MARRGATSEDMDSRARIEAPTPSRNGAACNFEHINALLSDRDEQSFASPPPLSCLTLHTLASSTGNDLNRVAMFEDV